MAAGAASASLCEGRPFPFHSVLPPFAFGCHAPSSFSPSWFCVVLFFRLRPCNIFIHFAHVAYHYLRRLHTIVCFPFPVPLRPPVLLPLWISLQATPYRSSHPLEAPACCFHAPILPSALSASVHSKTRPPPTLPSLPHLHRSVPCASFHASMIRYLLCFSFLSLVQVATFIPAT